MNPLEKVRDCDTGKPTQPGEYKLTDAAYAQLVHRLTLRKFDLLTTELKDNITNYYSNLNAPFATRKSKDQWKMTLQELDNLKAAAPVVSVSQPASLN